MKELVEYIVKKLVSKPEEVVVNESSSGDGMVDLELVVAPEDMGLVIGKKGQTIIAIRRLLTVRAMNENVRVNLRLKDEASEAAHEV